MVVKVRKIVVEVESLEAVAFLHSCVATYHDALHRAFKDKTDFGLSKKQMKRDIVRCHRLMSDFETILEELK